MQSNLSSHRFDLMTRYKSLHRLRLGNLNIIKVRIEKEKETYHQQYLRIDRLRLPFLKFGLLNLIN